MALLPRTWRAARLVADAGENIANVLAYGAVGDDATNDSQAFADAIASLEDGSVLSIPGGRTYFLPDGPFNISQSSILIKSDGMAVLNFGGGQGFVLTGTDQHDVTVQGLHFKNFTGTGFGVASNVDVTKRRILVLNNRFTDVSTATASVICVGLSCRVSGCRVEGNHIENIVSTLTTGNPAVYGIIVGRKGDTLAGSRTGEAWSYGYDGADITTMESGNIITGNVIKKLRGSGAAATDPVTAILADGWRPVITGNVIEDIRYVGAGTPIASGEGIYVRGYNQVVTDNAVQDCTWAHVTYKDGSSSTNFGQLGKGVIANNTFRGTAGNALGTPVEATRIVEILNGNVLVSGNVFDRCVINSATGNPYLVFNGNYYGDVTIENNTFIECISSNVIGVAGSNQIVRGNRIIRPRGPETATDRFVGIYYYGTGATAKGLVIEDNVFEIDDSALRANVGCRGILLEGVDHALHNVSIKNNKFNGFSSAPTESWYFVYLNVGFDGHRTWVVESNTTDGGWRGASNTTMNYINVALDGATAYPTGFRWAWDFGGPLDVRAGTNSPLVADESGAHLTNQGASGTETWALPAALPGMEFTFSREAAQALRIDPNGSEVIGDGGAGKYLELTHYGTVRLVCNVAGRWTVDRLTAWNDPGAAGTPTPGWLWQA